MSPNSQSAFHDVEWTEQNIRRLWDFYGSNPAYKNAYFAGHSGHRILREAGRLVEFKGVIVDIGCGPGYMLKHLKNVYGWNEYIGIDSSHDSLAGIKKVRDESGRLIKSIHVSEVNECLNSDIADIVLCVEVVEHCDDQALNNVFVSIRRLLKPGGHLVLTTPNNEDLTKSFNVCPECGCVYHKWQHIRSWTCESMHKKLAEYGLKPKKIYTCNFLQDSFGFGFTERLLLTMRYGGHWRYTRTNKPHLIAVATL